MSVVGQHNLDNIFDTLLANIQLIIDELHGGETNRQPDEHFKLDDFWIKMGQVFRSVSKEATKLSLLFSKPPIPSVEETQSMLSSLEMNAVALLSVFYSLPKHRGIVLRNSTKHAVGNIVETVKVLVTKIKNSKYEFSESELQSTGSVWEVCDLFDDLPMNNKAAVIIKMNEVKDLVKDAMTELEEAETADSHGDDWQGFEDLVGPDSSNEDTWSEKDKDVLLACIGLLKVTRSCLKKVTATLKKNGQWEEDQHVAQLDDIADICEKISPCVDELAEALYPPLTHENVTKKIEQLTSVLRNLLERTKSSHICSEEDRTWIDFLFNAIDHNLDKINGAIK
ncbi:cyclin-D1-binding protein 1 homolog isoform X2 [Anneissia japonica]|nr:cyclin-D1-binding protein 1 homolog isoform X2 [Anneissia japonica]XP_033112321.1 cyclin-D1-binding protein 1 homolog isoform X2 [Anneissia japonica]